ncbi:FAD-linked sulfhydryl oxidase, partial [Alienimonas sp. DA493]|uniref:FAD-linked sulfhydryl oxidase n=1 Tax=Alienimonas sp. DA493 TaxID=3373605 RepID=UPI003755345E
MTHWRNTPVLLLDGPDDWASAALAETSGHWLAHDPDKAARVASLPPGPKREAMARQWGFAARRAAHAAGRGVLAAGPGVAALASGPGVRVVRPGERVAVEVRRSEAVSRQVGALVDRTRPNVTPKSAEGWRMLHEYALRYDGDAEAAGAWLDRFAAGLGCDDCRGHWRKLTAENPPDLTDAETFFASSVAWHNAVNRRIGKPEVTVAEARERWREPVRRVEH